MAFRSRSSQRASPSGSNTAASTSRSTYENSPFESVATPRAPSRATPVSDWLDTVATEMAIDRSARASPAPEVIDLTADDTPPASQSSAAPPPTQGNGGGHSLGATSGSGGGGFKVAGSAASGTGGVAAGGSRSIGKMKAPGRWDSVPHGRTPRAARVDQPAPGPAPRESGARADAHTASETAQILSKLSDINDAVQQLSRAEKQRKEEARRHHRENLKRHDQAEKNQILRYGIMVGILGRAPGQNAEPNAFNFPTYPYEVPPAPDTSQHTSQSSQNSPRSKVRSPRMSGYEDPRKSKGSRGKQRKNRLSKIRGQSTSLTGSCTPQSTPPGSVRGTPTNNSPAVRAPESVRTIKSEPSPFPTPATPSQHPQSPKREVFSRAPGGSPDYHPGSQSSAAS